MSHENGTGLKGTDLLTTASVNLPLGEHDHSLAVLQAIHYLVEGGHAEVVLVHGDAVHFCEHEGFELGGKQFGGRQTMESALADGGQQDDGIQKRGMVGGYHNATVGALPFPADDLRADPQKAGDHSRDLNEVIPEISYRTFF